MTVRSTAILLLVFALAACHSVEERSAPPAQTAMNPGTVPDPPPPPPPPPSRNEFEHPLYRFPPRVSPNDPVRGPAVPPFLIESVPPEHTEEARKARVQGIVILEVVIERDGRISRGKVLKPLPLGLTQRAIDAVKQWRYRPAKNEEGEPVRCLWNVTIDFRLP